MVKTFSTLGTYKEAKKSLLEVPKRRIFLPSGNNEGLKIDTMKHLNE
jgi:hypothetical protein